MTTEELNEAIARAKGWTHLDRHGWFDANGCIAQLPNYTDPAECWGLLMELPYGYLSNESDDDEGPSWICSFGEGQAVHEEHAATAEDAICRAWLAWKEGAVDECRRIRDKNN